MCWLYCVCNKAYPKIPRSMAENNVCTDRSVCYYKLRVHFKGHNATRY